MAINRLVLLQMGTLCFVLLMLMPAAHGKKGSGTGVLMLYSTAQCKSNPSRTINNTTLLLVTINGTMVATGKTSSSGRFLLVANVTSKNQLMALTRKKELAIIAPPQACGGGGSGSTSVPTAAAGRKLAVAAGVVIDSDDDDDVKITDLQMMVVLNGDSNVVDQLVDDILNSPPSQFEIDQFLQNGSSELNTINVTIDQLPEIIDNLYGPYSLNPTAFLNLTDDFLGLYTYTPH